MRRNRPRQRVQLSVPEPKPEDKLKLFEALARPDHDRHSQDPATHKPPGFSQGRDGNVPRRHWRPETLRLSGLGKGFRVRTTQLPRVSTAAVGPGDTLRWGQVIAFAVRQPALATALGLIGEATFKPPDDFLEVGGWLYVGLKPGGDFPRRPRRGTRRTDPTAHRRPLHLRRGAVSRGRREPHARRRLPRSAAVRHRLCSTGARTASAGQNRR